MDKSLTRPQDALLRLIRHQVFSPAQNALKKMHPADLAGLFHYLTETEKKWLAENILTSGKLAGVISELEENLVSRFLSLIPEKQFIKALQEMSPDDAVDTLLILPEEKQRQVFEQLTGITKTAIAKLLGFAPDTAGGIMTTEFFALPEKTSVEKAIVQLRGYENKPEILYIYVVDEHQRLSGVVSFRDLVLSRTDSTLAEIMLSDPVSVRADTYQEDAAGIIARYDLLALPVTDDNHRLIGQITVDDAIDVLYEEATEDIYHLASLGREEHIQTPVIVSTKLRAPWLLINLGTAILASFTVSLFEKTISQYVVLAVLMPIVAGMGGNAGTQTLTVVVRGLALGEVDWSLGLKVIAKEMGVGLLNGILNGLVMAGIALVWYRNGGLAVVMFLAMIGNLVTAGLFGALVPLVLRKINQDPALGSSIFVTTATDVGGFVVFLGLSTLLINYLV